MIAGLLLKTNASNALVNKENEIFTPSASLPEKSCSKSVQKNTSTGPKTDALKNAENQPQLLVVALFLPTSLVESLLKSTVCSVKPSETLKSICALVNASLLLLTKTERWRNNAVAALPPRPLNELLPLLAQMVPPGATPLNWLKNVVAV